MMPGEFFRIGRLILPVFLLVALVAEGRFARAAPEPGYVFGSASAPITIQVFSSLTCPSCAKLHLETLPPLTESYVAEGRVRIVLCLLSSRQDPLGLLATRCVHAARRLGRCDDVTAALFAAQRTWMRDGNLEPVLSDVLASEEMDRLRGLLKSDELDGEIQAEIEAGREARIRATPTMVVQHGNRQVPIVGAVSYGILSRYLDKLLKDSR
jgi:protein-disulfide isomerase